MSSKDKIQPVSTMSVPSQFKVGSKSVQSWFKVGSKSDQSRIKVSSKSVQSRIKVGSKSVQSLCKVCAKSVTSRGGRGFQQVATRDFNLVDDFQRVALMLERVVYYYLILFGLHVAYKRHIIGFFAHRNKGSLVHR